MHKILNTVLTQSFGFLASDAKDLCDQASLHEFNKGDYLARDNEYCGQLWFIGDGIVRNFYLRSDGKEFNKSFIVAPSFCGSMHEWVLDDSARFSIQALTPVKALAIPFSWLKHQNSPSYQHLTLVMAQGLALKKEAREASLLLDDATTRYQQFCQEYPGLEDRIPAYHIASYIGITEVALSRLKSKLSN